MSYAIGVIVFSVGILLSIMLHEYGHFSTARHYGMKASRFFVGFGPTLWSTRRGETEYGVKALPFGGFVKIDGMTALEAVDPADEARAFYKQPAGRRLVVLCAGSFTHFVMAIVLVFGILAVTGKDQLDASPTTTIDQVEKCVPLKVTETACSTTDPKAPAFGKLHAGDKVVAVNKTPITTYGELSRALEAQPGQLLVLTVLRDDHPLNVPLVTAAVKRGDKLVGKIGIAPRIEGNPVSVTGAFGRTFTTLGSLIASSGKALGDLPHQVEDIFSGKPRDNQGAASIVDVARVSGQITSSGLGTGDVVAALLMILAEVNLAVGLLNMLPLLPFDGGHVAIIGFEESRSRLYRLFGRRDPGRVDIMKILPVTYAVFAVIVGLSLVLLYAGITNPISIQ
ncbi:MAG TPA: site-2 protease family protein [Mycobacteriales bacterium]|jgi:membrane-associated protease RseP (regulator of RpoE activity)|nr:site-2 protease family protein [Mycobacteriales bacterium]